MRKLAHLDHRYKRKSHIFTQTTHAALPPPKLSCGVGSQVPSKLV